MPEINLLNSFSTSSQIPLDSKLYVNTLAELIDLGTNNVKAYKYYEDMTLQCVETHTEYIWREEKTINEQGGLLSTSFTYPVGVISNGIDYSERTFNLFKKENSLESFTVKGTSIGKYNDGDIIPAHNSNDERWKDAGTKQILPTFIEPIVGLNGVLTSPNDSYEVGTVRDVQLSPQFTKNDGGDLNSCIIEQDGVEIYNDTFISSPIVNLEFTSAPIEFQTIISHDSGTIPKDDNLGESIPNDIVADTKYSSYVRYQGYLPIFYGSSSNELSTSSEIRSLTKALINSGNIFNMETGVINKTFKIFIPTGTNLVSVLHTNINDNITNQFVSQDVTIKDIGGSNNIIGKLYTYSNSIPFDTSQTFKITIQ